MTSKDERRCPFCGSSEVGPLEYGLPGPELTEAAKRGQVATGRLHCNAALSSFLLQRLVCGSSLAAIGVGAV
jgi:hypothetical protein